MAIKSFLFSSVPNILYELGSSAKVGSIAKKLGCKSVVVVTDNGLKKLGLTDKIVEGIEKEGFKASIYHKVVEDPPETVVNELIDFCKSNDSDGVVGLGGGSSMDAAKLAAFMC